MKIMNKRKGLLKIITAVLLLSVMFTLLCSCQKEERSVRSVRINDKGELIVVFTDGTESNMGPVKGEKGDAGTDGRDGENGVNGVDGKDGSDGEKGDKGSTGTQGKNGRSIKKVTTTLDGNIRFHYDDDTYCDVNTRGELFLFGGDCGEKAKWALYSGGVLIISGEEKTYDYEEGKTPWTPVISLISAVYVDTSKGLELGSNILYGMENVPRFDYEPSTIYWIDMTVAAPIYALPEDVKSGTAKPIASIPLGEEVEVLNKNDAEGYAKILYAHEYAYISVVYLRDNSGSVVYDQADCLLDIINDNGAKLRTFPDSYSNNVKLTVPKGEKLNCTGISKNCNWYRVTYNGETLYAYKSVVEIAE